MAEEIVTDTEEQPPAESGDWFEAVRDIVIMDLWAPPECAVGEGFDADAFGHAVKRAGLECVALAAKGVEGYGYFEAAGEWKHPQLACDLLRLQVESLARREVHILLHYPVAWDERVAADHPEWRVPGAGEQAPAGWLRLNTDFIDQIVAPQVESLIAAFPEAKGIFFDGVVAEDETAVVAVAKRLNELVQSKRADWQVIIGSEHAPGVSLGEFAEQTGLAVVLVDGIERGPWDAARRLRQAERWGLRTGARISRFHGRVGRFGTARPLSQLRFEAAQAVTHGATPVFWDVLGPSGCAEPAIVARLGQVDKFLQGRVDAMDGAASLAEAAVLVGQPALAESEAVDGAIKLMSESAVAFDVIGPEDDFSNYRLLVVPDGANLASEIQNKAMAFMANDGGALLAALLPFTTQMSLLPDALGLLEVQETTGDRGYVRVTGEDISSGIPATDWVFEGGHQLFTDSPTCESLAEWRPPVDAVAPWAPYAPPQAEAAGSAITRSAMGEGKSIYFAFPIFTNFARRNDAISRRLLSNALNLLFPPESRMVSVSAPPTVSLAVARQENRLLLHLLQWAPTGGCADAPVIDATVPVTDIEVSVKLKKSPRRVHRLSSDEVILWKREDDSVVFTIDRLELHETIAIEGVF